jgi:hypothetical protein
VAVGLADALGVLTGDVTFWLGLATGLAGLDEQPASSAASTARPASDRFKVGDIG